MDKNVLQKLASDGLSRQQIADFLGKNRSTINNWLLKYNIKTIPKNGGNQYTVEFNVKNFDWKSFNEFYETNSLNDSLKKFKLKRCSFRRGVELGKTSVRSHRDTMKMFSEQGKLTGGTWSEEARQKARERMLKRIAVNPTNHPNRKLANNRTKMSFPEKVLYDYLKSKKIKFKHNEYIKPYWPDFLIGKLIIEVDGQRWHDKEYDKKRDEFLISKGYIVERFSAKDIIKDVSIVDTVIRGVA